MTQNEGDESLQYQTIIFWTTLICNTISKLVSLRIQFQESYFLLFYYIRKLVFP